MKIITWNIYDQNKNISKSLQYIFSFTPDIICLQEFPNKNKNELILNYGEYNFFFAKDCSLVRPKHEDDELSLLVIGVKKTFNCKVKNVPLEIKNNNHYTKKYGTRESVEGMVASIKHKKKSFNILNLHLNLFCGYNIRIKQFNTILKQSKLKHKIICGDLNNFSHYGLNWIFGYLFGFMKGEYLVNEKKIFQEIFKESDLKNPFYKKITHTTLRQLDHILYNGFKMKKKSLLYRSLKYSDHVALSIELE